MKCKHGHSFLGKNQLSPKCRISDTARVKKNLAFNLQMLSLTLIRFSPHE